MVQELIAMIAQNGWQEIFEKGIQNCISQNVVTLDDIHCLDDWFDWLDAQLTWIPVENNYGTEVYNHLVKFSFIVDQEPIKSLQNKEAPAVPQPQLTPFSAWIDRFFHAQGAFLDTPQSINPESLATFADSPNYHEDEYEEPRGGWKTFNEWFARYTKPGYRPIAAQDDDTIITMAADATWAGLWEIRADSGVTVKGLDWKIAELLEGSPYKDEFLGGNFVHAFLNTSDYHRQHAPISGKVIEARVIQGCEYVNVIAIPDPENPGRNKLVKQRVLEAPDNAGYEFMQTRGLIIIDNPYVGKVAVLPMGMGQVSSVILTAEVGRTLRKGEEISYFQFGGSDIVMVFQNQSNISFTAQPGVHYKFGTRIGKAYPVIPKFRG